MTCRIGAIFSLFSSGRASFVGCDAGMLDGGSPSPDAVQTNSACEAALHVDTGFRQLDSVAEVCVVGPARVVMGVDVAAATALPGICACCSCPIDEPLTATG